MRVERTQAYELHLTIFLPNVSHAAAGDVLMATGPEPTVQEADQAYTGVFSEVDSKSMPNHGL
jgi:hypothetical protein